MALKCLSFTLLVKDAFAAKVWNNFGVTESFSVLFTISNIFKVGNESQNLSNFDSTTTADKCHHSTETQDTLILTGMHTLITVFAHISAKNMSPYQRVNQ